MEQSLSFIISVLLFSLTYLLGPFLTVVGAVFAYALSIDTRVHDLAKAAGWVAGFLLGIIVGAGLTPLFFPSLADSVFQPIGVVFLFGYGWFAAWLAVSHLSKGKSQSSKETHAPQTRQSPRQKRVERTQFEKNRMRSARDLRW